MSYLRGGGFLYKRIVQDLDELCSKIYDQKDLDYYTKEEYNCRRIGYEVALNCMVDLKRDIKQSITLTSADNKVHYLKLNLNIDENVREYLDLPNIEINENLRYLISLLVSDCVVHLFSDIDEIYYEMLRFDNTIYLALNNENNISKMGFFKYILLDFCHVSLSLADKISMFRNIHNNDNRDVYKRSKDDFINRRVV